MRAFRSSGKWKVDWRDHRGVRRRWGSFTRKDQAEAFGRRLEELADCVRTETRPSPGPADWLGHLGPRDRRRLEAVGLLQLSSDVSSAIDAWETSLRNRERTSSHIQSHTARVRIAAERLGAVRLTDLTPEAVESLVAALRRETADHWARSAATANHYIVALKHFCRWCVDTGRLPLDPLAKVRRLAVLERAKVRRALPPVDIAKLLKKTEGTPRGWLYRLAIETGFRYGELVSLTPGSFVLAKAPSVTVAAAYSRKHRRDRTVPLLKSTAKQLKDWLQERAPDAPLFAGLHARPELAAPVLRSDLEGAGVKQPDAYDFHCLRHTFCTLLGRTGVDLQTFMSLTGHRSATVALGYIHDDEGERRKAMTIVRAMSAGTDVARPGDETT